MLEETRRELLDCFRIPETCNAYVLGSFAKRVTFYSQQVRALNLMAALFEPDRGAPRAHLVGAESRVCVIGGGAAGLTAAAAAAAYGATVVLLEQESDVLPIQRAGTQRYLHPHIYDWPNVGWEDPDAGLPLLNWQAGNCDTVCATIADGWRKALSALEPRITPRFRTIVRHLDVARGAGKHVVTWEDPHSGGSAAFDVVVIAVGFGTERQTIRGSTRYWDNDDLDNLRQTRSWLVSGTGDGGLTDLMRLCLRNFDHAAVMGQFATMPELKSLFGRTLEIDREARTDEDLTSSYVGLFRENGVDKARELVRRAGLHHRDELPPPILTSRSRTMLSRGTMRLNRFIVALLSVGKLFRFLPADPTRDPEEQDGKLLAWFADGSSAPFDRVVQRHGVESALQRLIDGAAPSLQRCLASLASAWTERDADADITKRPHYDLEHLRLRPAREPLVWKISGYPWEKRAKRFDRTGVASVALISSSSLDGGSDLERSVRNWFLGRDMHVRDVEDRLQEWQIRLSRAPFAIELPDAANPDRFDRTLRELCGVDIAIFDISRTVDGASDPMLWFLLGIRAVVRRGVTILAVGQHKGDREAIWSRLPFNVREMNFVSLGEARVADHLKDLVIYGLRGLMSTSDYADVPAFMLVRRTNRNDHLLVPAQERVLLLRPFGDEGDAVSIENLEVPLGNEGVGAVDRVIDIRSPELSSPLLYHHLRRCELCVFDWSGLRSNVFFELGVRCASSDRGVLCIALPGSLCDDEGASDRDRRALRQLREWFQPIEFRGDGKTNEMIRQTYRALMDQEKESPLLGRLSRSYTFSVLTDAIAIEEEAPSAQPDAQLLEYFDRYGSEGTSAGRSRHLFGKNPTIERELQRTAIRHLAAAWLYAHVRRQTSDAQIFEKNFLSIDGKLGAVLKLVNDGEIRVDDGLQQLLHRCEQLRKGGS